jgi:hypothetical protein
MLPVLSTAKISVNDAASIIQRSSSTVLSFKRLLQNSQDSYHANNDNKFITTNDTKYEEIDALGLSIRKGTKTT